MKIVHWLAVIVMALGWQHAALADPVLDYFRAVQIDSASGVRAALKLADANALSPVSGEPALVMALREDALEAFEVLLAQPGIDIEQAAPNGNTPLMMAAFRHHKKAVLALIDKGAIINRKGWSALHYAAASGDQDIARILLARGAAIDAPARGLLTPLMMAAREGHEAMVGLLLAAGADPAPTDSDNQTALQIAQKADKPRIAALIAGHLTRKGAAKP
jgi:ankyrin repeat protein